MAWNLCQCMTQFGERLIDNKKLRFWAEKQITEKNESIISWLSEELKQQAKEIKMVEDNCKVKFGNASTYLEDASNSLKSCIGEEGAEFTACIVSVINLIDMSKMELRRKCEVV